MRVKLSLGALGTGAVALPLAVCQCSNVGASGEIQPPPVNAMGGDASGDDGTSTLPPGPEGRQGCGEGRWCSVPLPGGLHIRLNGVWGSGPNDVWIVGAPDWLFHWDGAKLTTTTVGSGTTIFGVWGSSASDVWIYSAGNGIWHSDGFVDGDAGLVPHLVGPWDTAVTTLWGTAKTDVWAVGPYTLINQVREMPSSWHSNGWTADAGPSWKEVDVGTTPAGNIDNIRDYGLRGIWGSSADDVWLVGVDGRTRHVTSAFNGPSTHWEAVNSHTSRDLHGIWGPSSELVWAVGARGTIVRFAKTEFGVFSGSVVPSPTSETLRAIWGTGNVAWVVGEGGSVLRWDGAEGWTGELEPDAGSGQPLYAIWGSGPEDVWAVGDDVILHRGRVAAALNGAR